MAANSITVDIFGKYVGLKKALKEAEGELDKFRGHVDNASKKMMAAGAAMTAGVTLPILGMAKSLADSASDMNETLSKNIAVFEDWSLDVEQWADKAAESIGMSRKAAIDAADSFGLMFKNAGKTNSDAMDMSFAFAQLSADLASFYNATTDEAAQALGAGLRGESEPLRRFGVFLDDATLRAEALKLGLIKTTKEALTPQQKILASYNVIMAQTKTAQGDFARTSAGAANQQRILAARIENLKTELGQKLLPIMASIIEKLQKAVTWFSNLSEDKKKMIMVAIGLVAALGPLLFIIGAITKAMVLLTSPVGLIIVGLALLVAGVIYAYKNWEWFRNIVDAVARFIMQKVVPALRQLWSWFQEYIWPVIKTVATWLGEHLAKGISAVAGFVTDTLIPAISEMWRWFNDNIMPVVKSLIGFFGELAGLVGAILAPAFDLVKAAAEKVHEGFGKLWDKSAPLRDMLKEIANDGVDYLKTAFETLLGVINKVLGVFKSIVDKGTAAVNTTRNVIDNITGRGGSVKGVVSSLGTTQPPGKAMGGPVSANSPYIVGEVGPELFVPKTAGTIVPNHSLGGTSVVINNYGNTNPQQISREVVWQLKGRG